MLNFFACRVIIMSCQNIDYSYTRDSLINKKQIKVL